jgi:hypothetical protein
MTPQQYGPLIGVAFALVIILLRNRAPRTLRPQYLWVAPAIIVPLMALGIWGTSMQPGAAHTPFAVQDWAVLVVALALGGLTGWWRGKMTTIEKHEDGTLKAQASPIGMILIVVLLLGRNALRAFLAPHAAAVGLNETAVADAFLVFVVGTIIVQRVEMYIRARRVQHGGTDSHVETTT